VHRTVPAMAVSVMTHPVKRQLSQRGYNVSLTAGRCAYCDMANRVFHSVAALAAHTKAKHRGMEPRFLEAGGGADGPPAADCDGAAAGGGRVAGMDTEPSAPVLTSTSEVATSPPPVPVPGAVGAGGSINGPANTPPPPPGYV